MGAPVTTYADYNYNAYIATLNCDRIRGLTMGVGDTATLDVGGNDAGFDVYAWSTSDSLIVSIDSTFSLTAKKVGTATIYLRLKEDPNRVLDSITVTVLEKGSEGLATGDELTIDMPVSGVDKNGSTVMPSFSLMVGDEVTLVACNSKSSGDDEFVVDAATWASSDATVATVENGKITAKGVGKATITAKATIPVTKRDADGNEVMDEEEGEVVTEDKECTASLVVTVLPTPEPETTPKAEETPKPKSRNPKTGDGTAAMMVTYFGSVLVMALGVMLRLVTSKKKFEM